MEALMNLRKFRRLSTWTLLSIALMTAAAHPGDAQAQKKTRTPVSITTETGYVVKLLERDVHLFSLAAAPDGTAVIAYIRPGSEPRTRKQRELAIAFCNDAPCSTYTSTTVMEDPGIQGLEVAVNSAGDIAIALQHGLENNVVKKISIVQCKVSDQCAVSHVHQHPADIFITRVAKMDLMFSDGRPIHFYIHQPTSGEAPVLAVLHCGAICTPEDSRHFIKRDYPRYVAEFAATLFTRADIGDALPMLAVGAVSEAGLGVIDFLQCLDASCEEHLVHTREVHAYDISLGASPADDLPVLSHLQQHGFGFPTSPNPPLSELSAVKCIDFTCASAAVSTHVEQAYLRGTDVVVGEDGVPMILYAETTGTDVRPKIASCLDVLCVRMQIYRLGMSIFHWSRMDLLMVGRGSAQRGLMSFIHVEQGKETVGYLAHMLCPDRACKSPNDPGKSSP